MKITLLLIALLSVLGNESPVPPPELLPECISEYFYVWGFDEHPFCNEQTPFGYHHLFACRIKVQNDYFGEYETFTFVNKCVYADKLDSESEAYLILLPLVNNNQTIISHLP